MVFQDLHAEVELTVPSGILDGSAELQDGEPASWLRHATHLMATWRKEHSPDNGEAPYLDDS